jgi:outer membrane receptor protein involved in Fe transport
MRELAPFLTPDFARRRVVRGNPLLERTFIQNFDLRWELFPTPTEVFAISLFYKSFEEPIESVVYDQLGNITYQNIERATNFGAELEARVGLGQLSDSLESFNAFANLALIRSQVTLTEEQAVLATSRERPLAGQSPFVANIAFGYEPEENPFSAFVFYNVFGRRIQDVGTNGLPDVFEEPFHSLDVTAFYQLGDAWALSVSAGNLLLQDQRVTQGGLNFSRTKPGSNVGLKLSWAP